MAALAGKTDPVSRRLLLMWWQAQMELLPRDVPIQPSITETSHYLLKSLRSHFGRKVFGRYCPLAALLPCKSCGRIFESKAPHFASNCKECPKRSGEYTLPARHVSGAMQMWSDGFYPKGPAGPSGGYSVLCQHPDCIEFFLATRSDTRFCETHRDPKHRMQTLRRADDKFTRYRFRTADGDVSCSFCVDDSGVQRVCNITPSGYTATDLPEFTALLQAARTGSFAVYPIEEVPETLF